ncbi:hypothetical protein PENSPDRAFT_732222 [Peniophora sp. CONT]|nr:hypothetical protein PENSPDRAFT_732222 [Peniophora sp. CONT]
MSGAVGYNPPPLSNEDHENLEAYRFAQFAHEKAGVYFPSASELQKDIPNSVDGIKSHISQLKDRYAKDLDTLLDDQVERYYEDALDRYHSYDPACLPPIDDPEEWPRDYHTFKTIYHDENLRRPTTLISRFNTEVTTALAALNERQVPHLQKLKKLEESERARKKREEEQAAQAKREAEKRFPRTIADWENHSIATRKLWLARFLTFSFAEKEENMRKQNPPWTWDDVDPLNNIYKQDANFRDKIQKFIQSHGSTDPRRKPAA